MKLELRATSFATRQDLARFMVRFRLRNRLWVRAVCLDIAPPGVIDLAPSALAAAGLSPDAELSDTAEVEFLEGGAK